MSPRRYRMTARNHAVETTRRRIVDAAMRLHAARGAISTSWDDIADGAGVSRASVYHHFPSIEHLVPACALVAFDVIEVPTPQQAAAMFSDLPDARARLSRFIAESCRCYSAGAEWLRAAWRERDLVPAMGSAVDRLQRALQVLLAAALDGLELVPDQRRLLTTLLDFPFWDSLDRAGMPRASIPTQVELLARSAIGG